MNENELSKMITGCAIEVHKQSGPGKEWHKRNYKLKPLSTRKEDLVAMADCDKYN